MYTVFINMQTSLKDKFKTKQWIKQLSSKIWRRQSLNILSAIPKKQLTLSVGKKKEIKCNRKNATNILDLVNQMVHWYYP